MSRVLLTAFEPYDHWQENASWQALVEFTKDLPLEPKITTRRYPVDFQQVRERLESDLGDNYEFALHLGQAPGIASIQLEAVGLNIGGRSSQLPEEFQPLAGDGPMAFRSGLPLGDWAGRLRRSGIPAQVSYHAGTFLCNATLYLAHYLVAQRGLKTRAAFIHLPLTPKQVLAQRQDLPSMDPSVAAAALRLVVSALPRQPLS